MLKLNPNIVVREECDGTTLLFNPDNGEVFAVNFTGGVLYQALAAGAADEAALLKALQKACDGVTADALTEIRAFLDEALRRGIVAKTK